MKKFIFYIAIALLIILASINLKFSPIKFAEGIPNLFIFAKDAIPPDSTVLSVSIISIFETIQIAFLGTIFGMIFSLPLALLASRNIFNKKTVIPVRIILAAIRTMPSLLWAVIFVVMVGFGPFAGALAITMYTIGYLSKLQYESIEGISHEPLEAVSATGANKLKLIRFVVLPENANNLLSQLLFVFEYNVRASTILGFVGAGGIGFYIMGYLRFLEYNKVITLLFVVLITVLIIDYLSTKMRDNYLPNTKVAT